MQSTEIPTAVSDGKEIRGDEYVDAAVVKSVRPSNFFEDNGTAVEREQTFSGVIGGEVD